MDFTFLEKSALFHGIPAKEIQERLASVPHHIQHYEKGETIFHLMETAERTGIILEGRADAQKSFPNGSQVNVSVRQPGEMIGAAAAFSSAQTFPCDIMAIEPVTLLVFRKEALMQLMQKDVRILENFTGEIASATYMLQQRLELLSYSGIAQKAAFYLLLQRRKKGTGKIPIPESMTRWAMLLNVSRPSLHRELKRLESQKIIRLAPHLVEILDAKALQDVLTQ